MAAVVYTEKAIPSFNHSKNPRRNVRSSENLITPDYSFVSSKNGGLISSSSLFPSSFSSFHPQQPPLLPLPIVRSVSQIPPIQKLGKTKSQINLAPKKPKSASHSGGNKKALKGNDPSQSSKTTAAASTDRLLDPGAIPSRVLKARPLQIDLDDFSGSIFSLSPHPSSLPLPKFSLQPKAKIRCNAEASEGIDAGATDSLRRLLRLR